MSKLPLFLVAIFLVCSLSLFGNLNAIQGETMSNPAMLMNVKSTSHTLGYGVVHSGSIVVGQTWDYGYESDGLFASNYQSRGWLNWACSSYNFTDKYCASWGGYGDCSPYAVYNPRRYTCTAWTYGECVGWSGDLCDMGMAVSSEWTCTAWTGKVCSQWTGTSSGGMGAPSEVYCNAWNGDYCSHFVVVNSAGTGGVGIYYCSSGGTGMCQQACDGVSCSDYCNSSTRYYGGSCEAGSCSYANSQVCDYGCSGGSCLSPVHTVTLTSPAPDAQRLTMDTDFNFTLDTLGYTVKNCSLYTNVTGSLVATQSNQSNINPNGANTINYTPASGTLLWNVGCYFNTTVYFATSNRILNVLPNNIRLISPPDHSIVSSFNDHINFVYDLNTSADNCSIWSNFSGFWEENQTNQTSLTIGLNIINITTPPNGTYVWTVGCNQSGVLLDTNFSNVNFTFDVADCGDIYTDITMTRNVSSNGTCFNFKDDDLTLDCDGYSIQGNGSDVGVDNSGVRNEYYTGDSVQNCVVVNYSRGIVYGNYVGTTKVNGSILNNILFSCGYGVEILGANGGSGTKIYNNTIYSPLISSSFVVGVGVGVGPSDPKTNINVSYNTVRDFSGSPYVYGIYFFAGINSSIHNNIISNISGSSFARGLFIQNTNYSAVYDNNLSLILHEGIYVYGSSNSDIVRNNTVSASTFSGVGGMYFVNNLGAGLNNITIDCGNNHLVGNDSQKGIRILSSTNVTVQNCFIENTTVGVEFYQSHAGVVNNNTLYDNSIDGLYSYGSDSLSITNNNVSENGFPGGMCGMWLSGGSAGYVRYNSVLHNYPCGLALDGGTSQNQVWDNVFYNNTLIDLSIFSQTSFDSRRNVFNTCADNCLVVDTTNSSRFTDDVFNGLPDKTAISLRLTKDTTFTNISVSNARKDISFNRGYNDYVINSNLGQTSYESVEVYNNGNAYVLNSTINKTNCSVTSGNLSIGWYTRTLVIDNFSAPIEQATVQYSDVNGVTVLSANTGGDGYVTGYIPVYELFQNVSGIYNKTPHIFNATKSGYNYSFDLHSVSQPVNDITLMLRWVGTPNGGNCTNNTQCGSGYCNNGYCCDSGTCCNDPTHQDSCPVGNICTLEYNCTPTLANCQASAFSWLCTSGYASHGFCAPSGWGCGVPGAQSSCDSNFICYSTCYCIARSPACGNTTSSCMAPQPLYCDTYGQIGNNCATCGCPLAGQTCSSDGTCITHSYWYEFWKGVDWNLWKWLFILGALVAFFLGVFAFVKKKVDG